MKRLRPKGEQGSDLDCFGAAPKDWLMEDELS